MKEFAVTIVFKSTSFTCKVKEVNEEYAKSAAWNIAIFLGYQEKPINYIVEKAKK